MKTRQMWRLAVFSALLSLAGVAMDTNDWVQAEVSVEFSSRKVFYGYAMNREPIFIPEAALTLFGTVTPGVAAYCDLTDWGDQRRRGPTGYGDRSFRYQEIDPYVRAHHAFTEDEFGWLPTEVLLRIRYQYEYDPPYPNGDTNPDSHFITGCLALPELWIEPALNAEFDVDRDHGTYLNLCFGHSCVLAGSDAAPILAVRPDVAQGWGDANRNEAYSGVARCGPMDTMIRLTLEWHPAFWLTIAPPTPRITNFSSTGTSATAPAASVMAATRRTKAGISSGASRSRPISDECVAEIEASFPVAGTKVRISDGDHLDRPGPLAKRGGRSGVRRQAV